MKSDLQALVARARRGQLNPILAAHRVSGDMRGYRQAAVLALFTPSVRADAGGPNVAPVGATVDRAGGRSAGAGKANLEQTGAGQAGAGRTGAGQAGAGKAGERQPGTTQPGARVTGLDMFFVQRSPHLSHHPGQIALPGGGIDPGESPEAAAVRETEEEADV